MKNSTIIRVMLLGVIALAGILAIQSYWVVSTWNINEEEFNKKVNLALYNVAKALVEVNGGTLPARDVVKQRTSNYYIVNIADEIDEKELEYFLQRELEELALNIDFEYAVFDCHTNAMVYGNYYSYTPGERKNLELGNLPKDNEFTYYFGVKFPTRSGYLFGKMQLSIFFSVILLITTFFFAYSISIIFQQKRLSEMQKDFINNMTHEFKTPISTIKIASEVLLNNPAVKSDARLIQYAGIIRDQNQRLNHQVEKVLQLARIEQRNFELNKEPIELGGLVREVIETVRVRVEELKGDLHFLPGPSPVWVLADRVHLTNILHNLLDNAIKYCNVVPDIDVQIGGNQKIAQLCIQDRGIGIAKEYQSRVFDKFYRVPTGNIHNVKGFGLGLFYVKNICHAHGWKLQLGSEVNKGTTIKIEMPQCKPPQEPAPIVEYQSAKA